VRGGPIACRARTPIKPRRQRQESAPAITILFQRGRALSCHADTGRLFRPPLGGEGDESCTTLVSDRAAPSTTCSQLKELKLHELTN
jgi:hypothetical protein